MWLMWLSLAALVLLQWFIHCIVYKPENVKNDSFSAIKNGCGQNCSALRMSLPHQPLYQGTHHAVNGPARMHTHTLTTPTRTHTQINFHFN